MAVSNFAWEIAHLPLYTLWTEGKPGDLVFAVFHCTAGDLMIAFITLGIAVMLAGLNRWPDSRIVPVTVLTVSFGLAYTLFSEWLNVFVRQSWAYSELMPIIPMIDTGLSPMAQWFLLPLIGLRWARKFTK